MPVDFWFLLEGAKRAYDVVATYGAPYNSDEFLEAYSEASKKAVDLLSDIQQYSPDELRAGAKGLLRLITSVVTAYNGRKADINANYMVPVPSTADRLSRVRFCTKDRRYDTFHCFLELKDWALHDHGFPKGLLIPVERLDEELSDDAILMGAPWAFAHGKSYLVDDTFNLYEHLSNHEHESVRSEVKQYFERHKNELRSFISLPVAVPADQLHLVPWPTIAVVNIQSNRPRLMGWFAGNRRKLELTLVPLLQTFSHFVMKMYYDAPPETKVTQATSKQLG